MLKHYMQNANKAGVGLELLPGVKQLLQDLKVSSTITTTGQCAIGTKWAMPSCKSAAESARWIRLCRTSCM